MITIIKKLLDGFRPMLLALGGQVAASGLNFMLTVVLARYLGKEAFGVFSMVWLCLVFSAGLQISLLISPMLSIGPKFPDSRKENYFAAVLTMQILLSVTLAFLTATAVSAMVSLMNAGTAIELFFPVVVAVFTMQSQSFFSRYSFMEGNSFYATLSDIVRYTLTVIGVLALSWTQRMGLTNILWVISISSIFGISVLLPSQNISLSWSRIVFQLVLKKHWQLSRWLTPSVIVQWINDNFVMLISGFLLGPATVAVMRTCQVLMLMLAVLIKGMENVVPSMAARICHVSGHDKAMEFLKALTYIFGGLSLLSVFIVTIAPEFWLVLVFGGKYSSYGNILVAFGMVGIFNLFYYLLDVRFRTMMKAKHIFSANLWGAIWVLLSFYGLATWLGMEGAVISLIVASIIRYLVLLSKTRLKDSESFA